MRAWLIGSTTLQPATCAPLEKTETAGRRMPLLGASAALACLLGLPAIARADFVPPPGVTDYRLIFVTADGIDATSANIADYNSFATSEAALNPNLPSTTWTAVASTDQVSAVSNIACTPDCSNIPIFLVDGSEVTTSSTALFNTATVSLLEGISEDQYGNSTGGYVWTGSFSDGTANIQTFDQEIFDSTMGNGGAVEVGFSGPTDGAAIDIGTGWFVGDPTDGLTQEPIYAISGVISTPEPGTVSLLAFGGLMAGLARRFRRRHKPATGG
jgi:hypothetical protein